MAILESTSKSSDSPKHPGIDQQGRRSFIWKTGAAMSAVIASAAAGVSKSKKDPNDGRNDQIDRLSNQIGVLEDANAIRRLHQTYESHLDRGRYEEVVNLFADDAEVVYNGGSFTGKDKGVRRLYCLHFSRGLTGRKIEPAPGFEPTPDQQHDIVEVALDRKSASGRFPYSIQVGTPMEDDSALVEMSRLQGEGILKWWESGMQVVSYVKVGDQWKIQRLEYLVMAKANYKPGRFHAKPIEIAGFSRTFPADPKGPDRLI